MIVMGHNTRDNTLKNVSAMIYEHIRSSDYVFRYGGEEFMILLVETELSKAKIILENLRNKMADLRIRASTSESFRSRSVLASPNIRLSSWL